MPKNEEYFSDYYRLIAGGCAQWILYGGNVQEWDLNNLNKVQDVPTKGRCIGWTNSGDRTINRIGFVMQKTNKPMENGKFRIMGILK